MYAVDSTIDMKVTVYVDLCSKFYNLYDSTSKSEIRMRTEAQSAEQWVGGWVGVGVGLDLGGPYGCHHGSATQRVLVSVCPRCLGL